MGHVLYLTSNWQCLVFEVGVMIDRICPAVTRMSIFLVCVGCIQDDMGDEVTFSEFQASRGWLDSNSVKSQQITLKDLVNKGKLLRFSCLIGIVVLLAVTDGTSEWSPALDCHQYYYTVSQKNKTLNSCP